MNSTMDARLRRSCSAAATKAAFTSGGTRTLTTSVLVTAKGCSCMKNASVLQMVAGTEAATGWTSPRFGLKKKQALLQVTDRPRRIVPGDEFW